MEIRFDLPHGPEKSDRKAFYHVYYRLNPAARVLMIIRRTVCGGVGILNLLAVVGILMSEEDSPVNATVPAILGLILLLYAIGIQPLTIWLSKRDLTLPDERMVVTIHEDGVTDQTGSITTHYEYQAFYAVCYYRDIYMLFISRKAALLLPERFREGASSPAFKKFIEEKTHQSVKYFK